MMKYLSPAFWLNCLFSLLKFCAIYIPLGAVALLMVAACEQITVLSQSGWNIEQFIMLIETRDAVDFIDSVRSGLLKDIPLAEVADKMLSDSGGFVSIFMDFENGERLTFNDILPTLLPDAVKIIIANFVIYIFARLNTVLSHLFSGFFFKLGFFISMGIFGIAGFAVSAAALKLIDIYIPQDYTACVWVVMALLCFFMHSVCLSGKGTSKIPILRVTKHLGVNVIFGVLNSVLCWFVCFYLDGMYEYARFGAFVFAFIIFCIVLHVEKKLA